ncbi:phosphatidylserine decarboxylase protein [Rutstroemia sp. NJR-2017a BBW]|nr:phosphatidylserine decarboxylase protein [Rutstroemia sp. NJR-2017a BBW]
MNDHELGITAQSGKLCQQLLNATQEVPQNTLFSDDLLFEKTCRRLKGENETKIVHRISEFIVPSAELLADRGAKHLANIRETANACWTRSGSRSGPRPQPDFGFGFDRDAFNSEQLQRLQPFLGDLLADYSLFAVTYQMYFPFLTCEVKCGDGGLDVADRQNAYSQSVILRGLYWLFKVVGREKELHREISGFSISHNDEDVRIWGHYIFIDGTDVKFYRHLISKFVFVPSGEGDQRWKAYKFVKNVYDLWLPDHFKRICSAIDMLPADSNMEASNLPKTQSDLDFGSMRSGLSQQLANHSLIDEEVILNSQPTNQLATPEATVETEPHVPRKKKK